MQNKGLVRLFAILLTLVCVFYLSFSVVTNVYESKAKTLSQNAISENLLHSAPLLKTTLLTQFKTKFIIAI